ncbi:MAG: hypothetical protein Alis3KO_36170 [Aliiglaciecola sp.]
MFKHLLLFLGIVCSTSVFAAEPKGVIGEVYIDGFPVLYKFVNEFPNADFRSKYPRLVVVSWKYDGSESNGMPSYEINVRMMQLEEALESGIEDLGICTHIYSRTGNNLKELVYHIRDDEEFLKALNTALSSHERFPIEIIFYEDKEWKDFKELLNDFNKNS